MKEWSVAGGLILGDGGLLLVRNRRRDGSHDWSPPGGVIEPGESTMSGLTREVSEETGVEVLDWRGLVYEVEVEAPGMGWRARVEAHVAGTYQGEMRVADPDGIVVEAAWVELPSCRGHLEAGHRWVREPLGAWLDVACAGAAGLAGWEPRTYRYHVVGDSPASAVVTRI
ncbi:MAG: NUDIX hydrolase [Acidimicrobiales bacterium]